MNDVVISSAARPVIGSYGKGLAGGKPNGTVTARFLDGMKRRALKLGLVTLCIGGGQGIAMLLGRE